MTHVFIVDERTFKYHLEYMFAGIGSSREPVFLFQPECSNASNVLPWKSEISLAEMVADISRVSVGDKVIFYLMKKDDYNGGMFYGIFKVKGTPFFEDQNHNYLGQELGKYLSLRIEIEPDEVYAKGVTELEAIDSIEGIEHPWQMCWSLIYRKLKAGRGCTMITDYESNRLMDLIRTANNGVIISSDYYTFSAAEQVIKASNVSHLYEGIKNSIDIFPRLKVKYQRSKPFEAHLQAYLLQNIYNNSIKNTLLGAESNIVWVGNEVKCSFGMQSMDIVILDTFNNIFRVNLIELKAEEPYERIVRVQLKWYIKWLISYLLPNIEETNVEIRPIIIAQKPAEEAVIDYHRLCIEEDYPNAFGNGTVVKPIELFGFEIGDRLNFEKLF